MFLLNNDTQLHGFLEKWIFVEPIKDHDYWKQHFLDQKINDLEKYVKGTDGVSQNTTTSYSMIKNQNVNYDNFWKQKIKPRCEKLIKELHYKFDISKYIFWHQNYNNLGHHVPHHHGDATISGIYILELEKENTTVFYSRQENRKHSIVLDNVKEGDLILFDSTAWHSVDPCDGKKISVCFNVS